MGARASIGKLQPGFRAGPIRLDISFENALEEARVGGGRQANKHNTTRGDRDPANSNDLCLSLCTIDVE
eukprot:CAMPEP_0202829916 /NCGR_PEP_ID=MMETSP1389-20130828/15828_1 /ASSEMBLY_ACC=CAM_ASM_000865 /TAXON_ID=302021 /ORGANISM="Rhodomonas sp., Strain CCMP768" /LENGTH=68 /DNA_ID=CAMNT_0049503509 /DNA_START=317 /DNA_END=520 /DNA_ORIENTATION=-